MPDPRVSVPPSFRSAAFLATIAILLSTLSATAQGPRILPSRGMRLPAPRVAVRPATSETVPALPTVTISRDEYERLKAAAAARTQGFAKSLGSSRTSAVVSEVNYTAAVTGGTAKIACRLVVQSLAAGWSEIPIDFGDAAVGAISHGKSTTAYLRGLGHGRYALLVKEPGRHEIQLELRAAVESVSGSERFTFAGPAAGISTLDVVVPGSGQRITVGPTFVPQTVVSQPGTTRAKGHLAAASKVTVSWRPVLSGPEAAPSFTVDNHTRLTVGDETILSESRLTWQVHRGSVSTLSALVPAKDRILDVTCPAGAMSGWTVEKHKDHQQINVRLSRPITDKVIVTVRTQRTAAEGTVSVAGRDQSGTVYGVHVADTSRETGLLTLTSEPQWELSIPSQQGWSALEPADVPGGGAKPGERFVRYFHPKTPFSIVVQPVKPQLSVEQTSQYFVRRTAVTFASHLNYRIDRIGASSVSIQVPQGLTVNRVSGKRVKRFAVSGSPAVLRVDFDRRVTGEVRFTVHGQQSLAKAASIRQLPLALLEPDGVDRESGTVEVSADQSLDVASHPSATRGVTAVDLSSGPPSPFRLAWKYDVRPVRIGVQVTPKSPRIVAAVSTLVDVRESAIAVASDLAFSVAHAPVKSFRFALPAASAGSLRVTDDYGNPLTARTIGPLPVPVQKSPSGKTTAAADSSWTVMEVDAPAGEFELAEFRVKLRYDLDLPKSGDAGKPVHWEPVRVLGLSSVREVHGRITVRGARPFRLSIRPRGSDIEAVDGRATGFDPTVAGEHFRYHGEPAALAIGITKLEVETVAETVVSRGLVEVLLAGDATASYRARYRVLSSQRQRLRLDLPKSSEPLAAFVDGLQVPLERDPAAKVSEEWTSYLISVARSRPSNEEFSLAVHFRLPIKPAPFAAPLGRLRLHLPKLLSLKGGAAVVQQMRTVIWVPDGHALVGDADGFSRQTSTRLTGIGPRAATSRIDSGELETWIGMPFIGESDGAGGLEFPTQGHAYRFDSTGPMEQIELATADMPFAAWAFGVPLLLIGFVLARTTWRNRLNLALLLLFAGMIAAVSWGDVVYHALLAARYGIAGVIVLWAVQGVFQSRDRRRPEAARREPCPLPLTGLAAVVIPPPGSFGRNADTGK